jgi:hypothetical protein
MLISIVFGFITFILLQILVDSIVDLKIADEPYCRGDMTKIGAFFGLITMSGIIAYMIYFFIILPFIN